MVVVLQMAELVDQVPLRHGLLSAIQQAVDLEVPVASMARLEMTLYMLPAADQVPVAPTVVKVPEVVAAVVVVQG